MNNIENLANKWALSYLARFNISKAKLEEYLTKKILQHYKLYEASTYIDKALIDSIIAPIITKFINQKYLNDEFLLKNIILTYIKKGYSTKNMSLKLKQKQFNAQDIQYALNYHDIYEINLLSAINFIQKKHLFAFSKTVNNSNKKFKEINKLFLNGFSIEIIDTLKSATIEEIKLLKEQLLIKIDC